MILDHSDNSSTTSAIANAVYGLVEKQLLNTFHQALDERDQRELPPFSSPLNNSMLGTRFELIEAQRQINVEAMTRGSAKRPVLSESDQKTILEHPDVGIEEVIVALLYPHLRAIFGDRLTITETKQWLPTIEVYESELKDDLTNKRVKLTTSETVTHSRSRFKRFDKKPDLM